MTGEELKKLRKKAGITQKELALALEIQREMITRWETNGGISKVYQKILTDYFKKL
jgi:transcriptional regulator with XRE-family HTH domain